MLQRMVGNDATQRLIDGGTAGASLVPALQRDVIVAAKTYKRNDGNDRKQIGDAAAKAGSAKPELARQLARWMLDQAHVQTFANADKLRAYVADPVNAVVTTNPNYWVASYDYVSPHAWPAPNTFQANGYGAFNKLVVQVPQERGDMHDIRAALAIDPRLHVAVKVDDSRRLADAAAIVDYYRGYGSRVVLLCGVPLGGYAAVARSASSVTEILFRAAGAGDISGTLQQETTGNAHVTFATQYDTVLTGLHFPITETTRPFALINFRVSGHGIAGPRTASHPELDTGTIGFAQIWNMTKNSGYWPVPVGTVPSAALADCVVPGGATFDKAKHPHLIDYFKGVGPVSNAAAAAAAPLAKRQIEYGIFGRIAALFPQTRAIGMRSGGLDAIAYSGIPSISVDLAAEYDPGVGGLNPSHGHVSSWKRAAKKELILPGKFHQVFMDQLRPLGDLTKADWKGQLTQTAVDRIQTALTTFFGAWGDAGTTTAALSHQPVPATAPALLAQDVVNLFDKLEHARPNTGIAIDPALAGKLGIRAY